MGEAIVKPALGERITDSDCDVKYGATSISEARAASSELRTINRIPKLLALRGPKHAHGGEAWPRCMIRHPARLNDRRSARTAAAPSLTAQSESERRSSPPATSAKGMTAASRAASFRGTTWSSRTTIVKLRRRTTFATPERRKMLASNADVYGRVASMRIGFLRLWLGVPCCNHATKEPWLPKDAAHQRPIVRRISGCGGYFTSPRRRARCTAACRSCTSSFSRSRCT